MAENIKDMEEFTEGFKQSPFSWHPGMNMILTNEKRFCSRRELNKIIEKGFLTEPDIELMKVLYEHGYLSGRAAGDRICSDRGILPEHKRKRYRNSLKKLVKMGAVHRYLPNWEEDGITKNSACIYSLSAGASFYIEKLYRKDTSYFKYISQLVGDSPEVMLNSTVAGQFHSNVIKFHTEELKKAYVNYSFTVRKERYLLPLLYEFGKAGSRLYVAVFPVRSNERFECQAVRFISVLQVLSARKGSILTAPVYVFICENSSHARILAEKLKSSGYGNMPVLYCFDRSLIQTDIFKNVFTLEEENGGYLLQMQNICFSREKNES